MPSQVLRTLPENEAFYFYSAMDVSTGQRARNLEEFSAILKDIDAASISFHLSRKDFENWLALLQDQTLMRQLASIRRQKLPPNELRKKLLKVVNERIKKLQSVNN